jgi:hypothetical protein
LNFNIAFFWGGGAGAGAGKLGGGFPVILIHRHLHVGVALEDFHDTALIATTAVSSNVAEVLDVAF